MTVFAGCCLLWSANRAVIEVGGGGIGFVIWLLRSLALAFSSWSNFSIVSEIWFLVVPWAVNLLLRTELVCLRDCCWSSGGASVFGMGGGGIDGGRDGGGGGGWDGGGGKKDFWCCSCGAFTGGGGGGGDIILPLFAAIVFGNVIKVVVFFHNWLVLRSH